MKNLLLAAVVGICGFISLNTVGQDREAIERELQAANERIRELINYGEELSAAGRHEAAERAFAEAEAIEDRVRAFLQEREARQGRERESGDGERRELIEILEGLEHGMHALERLNRRDALDVVRRIADEVRRELQGGEEERPGERRMTEREVGLHQLEIMRSAMPALLEAGREDTAELLEHAIHARELAMEGRRDDEAMHIRETAPSLAQQIEILNYAGSLWAEFGHEEKADQLRELAASYREKWQRQRDAGERRERVERPQPEREPDRRGGEREMMRHELEGLRIAHGALREGGREDAAGIVERAIKARIVVLEGMEGEEARIVRERNPEPGELAEVCHMACELWLEFGNEENAHLCEAMRNHFREQARVTRARAEERNARSREQGERQRRDVNERERHIAELEQAIGQLSEQLEMLHRRLREIQDGGGDRLH